MFSPIARWLALNPLVPTLFAWQASHPAVLRRLLEGTGSRLDDEGRALYARLVRDPRHAAGALAMMASWDLRALARELPRLAVPLELLVGTADRTLPPSHAERIRACLPSARVTPLRGLGHLMHEEDAAGVWAVLCRLQPALAATAPGG
jgi:magnesium chelatase accessory protein